MLTLGGEHLWNHVKKKLNSQPTGAFVLIQLKKHAVSNILVCREET